MANKTKWIQYAIVVFGVFGILGGIALIAFGATFLSSINEDDGNSIVDAIHSHIKEEDSSLKYGNTNNDNKALTKFAIRVMAIIFIVSGIVYMIDGIISITGALKENRPLLIIVMIIVAYEHSALLGLCLGFGLYNVFSNFSGENFAAVFFVALRLILVSIFLHYIKKGQTERSASAAAAAYQYKEESKI